MNNAQWASPHLARPILFPDASRLRDNIGSCLHMACIVLANELFQEALDDRSQTNVFVVRRLMLSTIKIKDIVAGGCCWCRNNELEQIGNEALFMRSSFQICSSSLFKLLSQWSAGAVEALAARYLQVRAVGAEWVVWVLLLGAEGAEGRDEYGDRGCCRPPGQR